MNKPYIICHMMSSIDGKIDCNMTAQLVGNKEYYDTLAAIDCPTTLSGRVTAQEELTNGKKFISSNDDKIGKKSFAVNQHADQYEVVVDTKGTLLWNDDEDKNKPHIVITSELATKEYLNYLNQQHISWIAVGNSKINLAEAMEILSNKFGVKRLAIVGGGHINGGMLADGLIDEISLVIGPGVDGRQSQTSVFDGIIKSDTPIALKLKDVRQYSDGAVWLRYLTK